MMLAGCAAQSGAGVHAGDAYIVNSPRSLFYSYGPAQASGPDFALSHGTLLTMLSYEYGYSHVAVAATGQTGYVPTDDLAPAPKASPTPSLLALQSRHRRDDSRPPTPEEESQIPLPEFPQSEPPPNAPPFRY
jgi:hypothetical protein